MNLREKEKEKCIKKLLTTSRNVDRKIIHAIYRYNKQTTQINNDDNYQK